MPDKPLVANSLFEAYFYLMITACRSCGRGPLKGDDARGVEDTDGVSTVDVSHVCAACGLSSCLRFSLPHGLGTPAEGGPVVVNPTESPSLIIDVAQWITLFRMITEAAGHETNKISARRLGIEAAQCLDEAVKFYDEPGNDLPPPEALFHESSRERFRANPEQFSKQRLVNLRAKLPTESTMRASVASKVKKRWWRRGK